VGEAYAFGTYSKTDGVNDINWRNPAANPAIYKIVSVFPGFDLNKIYPAGFTPREGIHAGRPAVAGVRNRTSDVFTWDLSASYGQNASRFFLNNSINASLGPASPFDFDLGQLVQREANLNADAVWRLPVAGLADAAERRLRRRDPQGDLPRSRPAIRPPTRSAPARPWAWLPTPTASRASRPSRPGVEPAQLRRLSGRRRRPDRPLKRRRGAVRYEHFSDFGDTWNGKIAGRYEFTPNVAIRASYSPASAPRRPAS
jgi:iron complex outermembrane receptor protein